MKLLFIESKRKTEAIDLDSLNLEILPCKVFLAYSIQYKDIAQRLRDKLGNKVKGFKQVLGCSALQSSYPILLIGSGQFHALQLAIQGNEVYIFEGESIKKLDEKEVEKIKAKRKAAFSRFLSAKKLGILVSSKPGQENLKEALKLKEKLLKQGKEAAVFLADCINIGELENFNVDCWVNTACPALSQDSRIINLEEINRI